MLEHVAIVLLIVLVAVQEMRLNGVAHERDLLAACLRGLIEIDKTETERDPQGGSHGLL
jgi:hypothetical protein